MDLPSKKTSFSPREKGRLRPDFARIDEAAAEPRLRKRSISRRSKSLHEIYES